MPFRDLIGHARTRSLLSRAVASGTLAPSLIFGGPEGVGKRAAAIALAQALNCPAPPPPVDGLPADACGACAVCRRIARGMHPDVILVLPGDTGSIKIDAVREEIRRTAFRPFEGRRRVIVFDEADAILDDGQNALLKTLEEPPAGSVLILVTSRPSSLLPTVRSRCPLVRFGPLAPRDVAAWLMQTHGVAEPVARAAAGVAEGSLTRARAIAEAGVEDVREAAGRALRAVASTRDPRARLEATREIVGKGRGSGGGEREALAVHLRAMASLLRDLGAVAAGSAGEVVNRDLEPALAALAPAFDTARTLAAFAAVDRGLAALDRNASPKIVADWVVLHL